MKLNYIQANARHDELAGRIICTRPGAYMPEYDCWVSASQLWMQRKRLNLKLGVPCTSVRKFRRLLKRWSAHLPPGTKFTFFLTNQVIVGTTT